MQVKLGAVRLFELLPGRVERRIKKERKEAFLSKHTALLSSTQAKLDGLPTNESDKDKKKAIDDEKKELELLIEQLNSMVESYEDHGPLMDVVMFHQGGTWKAVIDLDADGDLSTATPMAPFAVNRDVGELRFGSAVTFCVQVYDEGKTLSIVTDAGSHGEFCGSCASKTHSMLCETHDAHQERTSPESRAATFRRRTMTRTT